ncbi:enoyl-CoA hydratase [Mycolicibacterium fallax]|uniref:Enoyl-CoA hydratase n=1 Tax=Mycolicibacterium fallax TaxID=1793 RepID=A0A1X1R9D4_MYCFA|nr:enoyl-CoA hydratase [Mycolicibacterium fallax]ORV01730.1 enoyl-CoA hydratase [Mycolicibacterium fallax]BBY98130.1 putative enoyl-CoA hydratase echA17 [Mycolicibacterium fallax]
MTHARPHHPREFVSVHTDPGTPGVGVLLLSRPPTNALTRQLCRELTDAAQEVDRRDDITVVILFGGHEMFCAGDDMPELRTLDAAGAEVGAEVRAQAIAAVAAIGKPTVAAVTGYALGAGLTLALAADWRVAGDNIKVGATEVLAGLIPDAPALAALTEVVGRGQAKDLVFSGRFVGAEEALELGLVDELVAPDGVYDAALARAQRFLDVPAAAVAAAKAIIDGRCDPAEASRRYAALLAGQDSSSSPVVV